jgi:hypothetical protein
MILHHLLRSKYISIQAHSVIIDILFLNDISSTLMLEISHPFVGKLLHSEYLTIYWLFLLNIFYIQGIYLFYTIINITHALSLT